MANPENASFSLARSNKPGPMFREVWRANEWIPPAKRLLLEQEADKTRWWLLDHGIWQNSNVLVEFPVDYTKDDRQIVAYPLQKRPDRPQRNVPTKYHLGSDGKIYALVGSTFLPFGTGQQPMLKDFDDIIEKLRKVRGE